MIRRYVASERRGQATTQSDVDWMQVLANTRGVRIIASTRRNVTFEATQEAIDLLRSLLEDRCIIESVIERRSPP